MNINLIKVFIEQNIKANITTLINDLKNHYFDDLYEVFSRIIIVDNIEEIDEAMEFYLVSPQLFELLQEHKEPTIHWKDLYIWGRTTSGQHIAHDNVIQDIVNSFN